MHEVLHRYTLIMLHAAVLLAIQCSYLAYYAQLLCIMMLKKTRLCIILYQVGMTRRLAISQFYIKIDKTYVTS